MNSQQNVSTICEYVDLHPCDIILEGKESCDFISGQIEFIIIIDWAIWIRVSMQAILAVNLAVH